LILEILFMTFGRLNKKQSEKIFVKIDLSLQKFRGKINPVVEI